MRDGVAVAGLGAGLGLWAGVIAARALSARLFSTSPLDPLTLGGDGAILLGVALAGVLRPRPPRHAAGAA